MDNRDVLLWVACLAVSVFLIVPTALSDFPILTLASNSETNPVLAYNPATDEFLTAYHSVTTPAGIPAVALQRLQRDGTLVGAPSYPFGFPELYGAIALAYNSQENNYLVVAYNPGGLYGTAGVWGRIVGADGTPTGGTALIMAGTPFSGDGIQALDMAYNTFANEYLVSAQLDAGGLADVWVRRVSAAGQPLGTVTNVTQGPYALDALALAYAPIPSAETPMGRYLLAYSANGILVVHMLGSEGQLLSVVYNCSTNTPVSAAVPLSTGSPAGASYHPDVAYGELGDQRVFLVVFADTNNNTPGDPSVDWTGIWGGVIDAEKLVYCTTEPALPSNPISQVCQHYSYTTGEYWWMPRTAYNPFTRSFPVVWRETTPDVPCNDVKVTHIRGATVDTPSSVGRPNVVLSQATGSYPGNEAPLHPALAVGNDGYAMVVWDDNRNPASVRDLYGTLYGLRNNNNCADAFRLAGDGTYHVGTFRVTSDGTSACDRGPIPDVWYSYVPSRDGELSLNTCASRADTILAVFSGCPGTPENEIVCNDDCDSLPGCSGGQSCLGLPVAAGVEYLIRVAVKPAGGFAEVAANPESDFAEVALEVEFIPGAPPNDRCENATEVGPGTILGDNTNANTEVEASCTSSHSDVWYVYRPQCNVTATISTCGPEGSLSDTVLSLYTACGSWELACNDDFCGVRSQITLPVVSEVPIYIRVASYGSTPQGTFPLTITEDANPLPLKVPWPGFYVTLWAQDIPALYRLDQDTLGLDFVGPTGTDNILSLAYDPHTGYLFGGTLHGFDSGSLVRIDPNTGAGVVVGALDTEYAVVREMAFDPGTRTLYGYEWVKDRYVRINPFTGGVTSIGSEGLPARWNLAFDSQNNILYGASSDDLLIVDPATGYTAVVGPFGGDVTNMPLMTYDAATGSLYGFDYSNVWFGYLVRIDKTTGHATRTAGPFEFTVEQQDVEGFEYIPGLPDGVEGQPYEARIPAAGGCPPYMFFDLVGLPPGLEYDRSGRVFGTPSQAGDFVIGFRVEDQSPATAGLGAALPLRIHPAPSCFAWGDVSGDGIAGTVDASLILRFDAFLIDSFPCCPETRPAFPPRGDVSGEGILGTVDAAQVLQFDAFLLGCFGAVDHNCDGWGPEGTNCP